MLKNRLMKCNSNLIRILAERDEKVLIVDCLRKFMPKWVKQSEIASYEECAEQELTSATNRIIYDYDSLDKASRRYVHEHYALIAGVLPFVGDKQMRTAVIAAVAEEKQISKQTIKNHLWQYLVYQNITALAPKQKAIDKPLTQDEKNMRWALNKYFYTRHKNSLPIAYTMMLKEKYSDTHGKLLPAYPTIHQFRYFYRKHRKMETYYISRNGLKDYQRNHRPLLGDGVQKFAPCIGVGMLDSTICDIYLVDDAGNLIGRPILTACVDVYSGLCCGYSLSWKGGVYSLRNLLMNVITDKVEWCRKFGISIKQAEWNCNQLPYTLVTDMGSEYKSANFEQLAELGVTIINLPSFRPELKGVVEKFFDLIQCSYKPYMKGRGVIEPDFQERGARDYRKDACLTMADFEKIVLHCIIYYNSKRVIESFPYTQEMLEADIPLHASDIWNWSKERHLDNLIPVSDKELILTLMPRTMGKFGRNGLKVNGIRYKNEDYTERYLIGGTAVVAYNPDDVSKVWLKESEIYTEFMLVESRFSGLNMEEIDLLKKEQKSRNKAKNSVFLQAKVDLARHIETIANCVIQHESTKIKQVRQTRKKEQIRNHTDYTKGWDQNG